MDGQALPLLNGVNVRKAVANAIDYRTIIRVVFNGHAQSWIGPAPPGFQYYNDSTAGISPYQYDPVQAAESLAAAGYVAHLPNGTVLNSGGKQFPTVPFLYDSDTPTDLSTAEIIQSDLAAIGIQINLQPLPFKEYATVIDSSASTNTTYSMGLGFYSEDYTAAIDYVSYFTQGDYVGSGGYYDSVTYNLTTTAATATSPSQIISALQSITKNMYQNYTDIWLYVPEFMAVTSNSVTGITPNPAGSGMGYFLYYNTIEYTS